MLIERYRVICLFRWALALTVMLAASGPCLAQSWPPAIPYEVLTSQKLTDAQIAVVKAYVDPHVAVLKNAESDPAVVERARKGLISEIIKPNVSPDFRFQYSKIIVPALEPVIKDGELHAAVNGILVLSALGTDRGMNTLLTHADSKTETSWQIRQRAAAGATVLLKQGKLDDGRRILEAARKLRDAALREDNGLILGHLFAALAAADRTELDAKGRDEAQKLLAEAFAASADRLAASAEAQQLDGHAIGSMIQGVMALRDWFTDPNTTRDWKGLGMRIAPSLGKLLALAKTHWEAGQKDRTLKELLSKMTAACDGLLVLIEMHVRQSQAQEKGLGRSWESGNKAKFDADVNIWLDTLRKAPYNAQP